MIYPRVSLEGAYDLHIHSAPSIYHRYLDDEEAARQAQAAGMRGIMIKSHFESTVSRSHLAMQGSPEIAVYGGIVLNRFVGGINPSAAEVALDQGAKQVWMPTIDAVEHRRVFGGAGFGLRSMDCKKTSTFPGYSVTDSSGKLTDVAKRVIELVSDYSAILGACHLVGNDLFAVVKYANSVGAKTLIAHPFFMVPNLKVAEVKQLAELGAISELTAITVLAPVRQSRPPLQLVKEAVESIGADRFIISSDAGQPFCPTPVEALRVYAEALFELGVSKMDLATMMVEIPEMLLAH